MKQRLLIVDDEPGIVDMMASYFSSQYEVLTAYCGNEALQKLARQPDLILLDINMPDIDGLTLCQKIRELITCPILFLTARVESADKIIGFQAGADDYITKPFGVMELVSRVKAVLRRTARKVKTVLVYKNIEIDENKHTVLVDGAEIDLTYKEYEILKHLIRNKGIVLTRDRLMEIVWGYNFEQGNRTVDVHIQSLRKKLGTAGEHIKTIRNVGYKVGE